MKTIRQSLVIGLTALGLATATFAAQAQTEGRYAHAASQQERAAKFAEHYAQRQAKLHDALKLSSAQEGAWATYQAAIKPQAPAARPDRAAFKAMSAPERMQAMITMQQQRLAAAQQRLPAVTAFYSQLSAEQKATFDKFSAHHGMRGRFGHGRGGHGHGGAEGQGA